MDINIVRILLVSLALCIVNNTGLKAQSDITLEEAIRIGLQNNFTVRIAENNFQITKNDHDRGNAGFLPTIDLQAEQDYSINSFSGTFANGDQISETGIRPTNFTSGAFFNWTLFDGNRMFIAYERLGTEKEVGGLNFQIAAEQLIADITGAYYSIIVEQERLRVFEEALKNSEERKKIAENRYEIGSGSKLDFLAAQVDYNADRAALISQKEALQSAKIDLNELLTTSLDEDFDLKSKIEFSDSLRFDQLEDDFYSSNRELKVVRYQLGISDYQRRELNALRIPQIELISNYTLGRNTNPVGFVTESTAYGFTYGVALRYNLFNGFNLNRQIQNAKIEVDNSRLQFEETELRLLAQLRKAYITYQKNLELYRLESENLDVAKENEEIALERYKLGNATPLEYREAQRNAVEAQSRLLDASFETKVSEINLIRLSGKLLVESELN
ncbi:MAG: TolC family protein [Cyclobacteriaceae bacterium]|nr:TolC family protein [Cyclobacteriaceae bacterium]MCH8517355.1 TolC family protein [Cyclobacteriaceae bacterium]